MPGPWPRHRCACGFAWSEISPVCLRSLPQSPIYSTSPSDRRSIARPKIQRKLFVRPMTFGGALFRARLRGGRPRTRRKPGRAAIRIAARKNLREEGLGRRCGRPHLPPASRSEACPTPGPGFATGPKRITADAVNRIAAAVVVSDLFWFRPAGPPHHLRLHGAGDPRGRLPSVARPALGRSDRSESGRAHASHGGGARRWQSVSHL